MKYKRNCPNCNRIIEYKTINNCKLANNKKAKCSHCRASGTSNSFYGKKHSKQTKDIIRIKLTGLKQSDATKKKKSVAGRGSNNPMHGKNIYNLWVEKYGATIADEKYLQLRKKRSENAKGKNNSMYGKEAPIGSGNGWSGWYKNWYFRSLRELSYMINVIEANQYKWESGEQSKFKIPYVDYKLTKRTYRPDFIINNSIIVEVKPIKLHKTPLIKIKAKAAKKFCKQHGLTYQLVDATILSAETINALYESDLLIWLPRYKEKFLKCYAK